MLIFSLALFVWPRRNFANFGSDILSVLYDLSSCTTGVIRQAALERTEILAKHWKTRYARRYRGGGGVFGGVCEATPGDWEDEGLVVH
jgi:hypothetical protein